MYRIVRQKCWCYTDARDQSPIESACYDKCRHFALKSWKIQHKIQNSPKFIFTCISNPKQSHRPYIHLLFWQLSPEIRMKGLRKCLINDALLCLLLLSRKLVLCLFFVVGDWWVGSCSDPQRESDEERESKVWRDVYACLYTGNLLHKSFAHYHIVMERHAYMSTPPQYSLSFGPLSVLLSLVVLGLTCIAVFILILAEVYMLLITELTGHKLQCESLLFAELSVGTSVGCMYLLLLHQMGSMYFTLLHQMSKWNGLTHDVHKANMYIFLPVLW